MFHRPPQRPILVTGTHRSGSTWVGQMIASHPRVGYVWEPFNPSNRFPDSPVQHWFEYVTPERAPAFIDYLSRQMRWQTPWWSEIVARPTPRRCAGATLRAVRAWWRRRRGLRPLLKDPIAVFSAEWLARTFDMDMVVLIRHPAAFASSIKRLGWRIRFRRLLDQPSLVEHYLHAFEAEMRTVLQRQENGGNDVLEEAGLFWRIVHHVIQRYRREHPSWNFVRHEDLSLRPREEFGRLLRALGLGMTRSVEQTIATHTDSNNPAEAPHKIAHQLKRSSQANVFNWMSRLTPAEIARVRRQTEDVARHFYTDADWTPSDWTPSAIHTQAS
ncbi:MAG: sulfotransferase [Gemmataceae bacterium]|nr:sulfotransferase [Gemmataceae bacterium]